MSNRPHLRPRPGNDGAALMGETMPMSSPLQGIHGQRLLHACVEAHQTSTPVVYEFEFQKNGKPVVFRVTVEVVEPEDDAEG